MKWYDQDHDDWSYNSGKGEWRNARRRIHAGAEYRYVPMFPTVAPAPVQPGCSASPLSHAAPVPGGFCGVLAFELEATTPVLFGRKSEQAGEKPAYTDHVRLHDGESAAYAAPGRAIRGLIRSVYGIATASRFQPVNGDHRFFSRNMEYITEFSGRLGSDAPSKPWRGWLRPRLSNDHKVVNWEITQDSMHSDCQGAGRSVTSADVVRAIKRKVGNREIDKRRFSGNPAVWNKNLSVKQKHQWLGAAGGDALNDLVPSDYYMVTAGTMYRRFAEALFPRPPKDYSDWVSVDQVAMSNFLYGNSAYKKDGAPYPTGDGQPGGKRSPRGNFELFLAEYLRGLSDGEVAKKISGLLGMAWSHVEKIATRNDMPPGIPVYCWRAPGDEAFEMGTSQIVPVAPAGKVSEFLDNTQTGLAGGAYDWADALFGLVEEKQDENDSARQLKGRVAFDFAPAVEAKEYCEPGCALKVVQGQPRGGFDPFTLRKKDPHNEMPAAWARMENAELNGYRRYPACASVRLDNAAVVDLSTPLGNNEGTAALVRPLKAGVTYHARIEFHNLHPLELGALLWAVSFGDRAVFSGGKTSYRHVAGRLRNKGLGRLRPKNARIAALEQNPMPKGLRWQTLFGPEPGDLIAPLLYAFEVAMGRHVAGHDGLAGDAARRAFYESETITMLLNSSDVDWDSVAAGHDRDKMFKVPVLQDNGGRTDFKFFSNLRRLHYKKTRTEGTDDATPTRQLPGPGRATILDEFLTPCGGPEQGPPAVAEPALAEADALELQTILAPARAVRKVLPGKD